MGKYGLNFVINEWIHYVSNPCNCEIVRVSPMFSEFLLVYPGNSLRKGIIN